mmetsp:Transcript_34578/g.40440  ORF Transcript_34578/g.40440 Transcript_34578/m.40440 type:complete len:433 (+) Transcript_34578:35-1333(+)|eukprot:CAMPEP_0176425876 /NCGR_PEP_ID=MMETSP0127-20121128/11628_1 /TAXON_ID=938130 /ORGANISM="Platyophrya macrostoma, Strain WH" /LENGTH=432 /DNA_ID=CAMNT_0017807077 /DNA_START=35 /DNA_END=1333 /DNA_ORIENTATION=+
MIKKGALTIAKSLSQMNTVSMRAFHTLNKCTVNYANPKTIQLYSRNQFFFGKGKMVVEVPKMGDSISEGTIQELTKKEGDVVALDEVIAIIETDKVKVDIRAQEGGKILKFFHKEGDTVEVGKQFYEIDTDVAPAEGGAKTEAKKEAPKKEEPKKEEPAKKAEEKPKAEEPKKEAAPAKKTEAPKATTATTSTKKKSAGTRDERIEPMSRLRIKVAQRLKESQNTNAFLTTFQEADMSAITDLRKDVQEEFQKKHGVKLGFMSFFVKAAVYALQEQPIVNAVIEDKNIKYRDYCDISVAVSTPTGLLTPIIRNAETLSFAEIEKAILDLSARGKDGKLAAEEMAGGTFTVTNGGVFGSLLSTPILNPPQSAILGMHSVVNRPVVRGDQIVARPMMYLALTYDHRIIDGRESVTFLKRIRQAIEDPRRMLLDL